MYLHYYDLSVLYLLQGVGVSLLVVQGMTGVYSVVVTSWMFVYFRDSFDTARDSYPWTECQRGAAAFSQLRHCGDSAAGGGNISLEQTIPDYFAAVVLQRALPIYPPSFETWFGSLKFQVVFNLAVIWMVIFICLSKGTKHYLCSNLALDK